MNGEQSLPHDAAGYDATLWNPDLSPTSREHRTWTWISFTWLWVGMVVNIAAYMTASSLMTQGLHWWQAILAVFLGNSIVVLPLILIGRIGVVYGLPFPVVLRSSFGVVGARLPAMLRAFVACGWFGIQTWIGASALYSILLIVFPALSGLWATEISVIGLNPMQLLSFLGFWGLHVFFVTRGIESIRWLEVVASPFLLLAGLMAMVWAISEMGGMSDLIEVTHQFVENRDDVSFWVAFGAGTTAVVGGWATLALNIPDFTRFARSNRDQVIGQALGLPLPAAFLAFVGVIVTSASLLTFGKALWNPVQLADRLDSWLAVVVLVFLMVATITTNMAANVVSPSNDFSNLAPRYISYRTGGYITVVIGVLMFPWKLLDTADAFIYTWLIGYGALLGPIAGIIIADYYVVQRQVLDKDDLFRRSGRYAYYQGWNPCGLLALAASILPFFPGFLHSVGLYDDAPRFFVEIYRYTWFIGLAIAFCVYTVSMRAGRRIAPCRF